MIPKLSGHDVGEPGSMRVLWAVAALLIGMMVLCEALAVPGRYFVNDDYQILYTAWLQHLGQVAPRDFGIQSYHVLPDLIRPFFNYFGPTLGVAFGARAVLVLLAALVPVLAAALASRCFPGPAAPFAAVASMASWAFLERCLDIRPDLLSSVLWLALLWLAAGSGPGRWRHWGVGCVLGLALVLRIKAVILLPGVALLLARSGWSGEGTPFAWRGYLSTLGRVAGGCLAIAALFAGYLALTHTLPYFIEGNRLLGQIAHQSAQDGSIKGQAFAHFLAHDPLLCALGVLGVAGCFSGCWKNGRETLLVVLGVLATGILFVVLNPAFYSYNFVILVPITSPFVGAGCCYALGFIKAWRWRFATAVGLLAAMPALHGPLLHRLATRATNGHQRVLAAALASTRPDTHVFALEGIGLFRPSIYNWRLSAISMPLYNAGRIDLQGQLRKAVPEVIIASYRIPGWLTQADRSWLSQRYYQVAPDLAVLAAGVDRTRVKQVLQVGRDQMFQVAGGPCRVDGKLRAAGEAFPLASGSHEIDLVEAPSLVYFLMPKLEALGGANLPYLISPESSLYEDGLW